jgi:segregation and condensation protein A
LTAPLTSPEAIDERACRVSLDVFDGPLDLLLNLVKEQQLDIATVPLAMVADQYFAYISAMEAIDVEVAADYLVIASTLVFLKSKALLPPIPVEFEAGGEESAEAVEARLRERLIAYSRYRDASLDLRALEAALRSAKPEVRTIVRERVSLTEQMEAVARLVRRDGRASFFALVTGGDRFTIVVTFLAVLELVRRGRCIVRQAAAFDDIEVLPAPPAEVALAS